jgi:hypothetical protein
MNYIDAINFDIHRGNFHETHLSTKQEKATEELRISQTDENQRWSRYHQSSAPFWT